MMKVSFSLSRYLAAGLVFTLAIGIGTIIFMYNLKPGDLNEGRVVYADTKKMPIMLEVHFEFTGSEEFPEAINLILDDIYVKSKDLDKEPSNASKICITEFTISMDTNGRQPLHSSFSHMNAGPVCMSTEALHWAPDDYLPFGISLVENLNRKISLAVMTSLDDTLYFAYPFDYISVIVGYVMKIAYLDEKGAKLKETIIDPSTTIMEYHKTKGFEYAFTGLLEDYEETMYFYGDSRTPLCIDMTRNCHLFKLTRPSLVVLMTALLLVFLLLVLILLPFVNSFDAALQTVATYLLGLWGIRQVIAPGQMVKPNMLDLVLMGYYSVAIFSMLLTLLRQYQAKQRVNNKSELLPEKCYSFAKSKVYHNSQCMILKAHNFQELIEHGSEEEARESGKRKCKLCST